MNEKIVKDFENWFRDYIIACATRAELYEDSVDGEQEVLDVTEKVREIVGNLTGKTFK